MKVWQIPESALEMQRPLPGRKRQPKDTATKPAKKSKKGAKG
jgi:hypothetical protein